MPPAHGAVTLASHLLQLAITSGMDLFLPARRISVGVGVVRNEAGVLGVKGD